MLNTPRRFTLVRHLYSLVMSSFWEDVFLFVSFFDRYPVDDPGEAKSYLGNLW